MVPGARDRAPLFGVPRTLKEHASSHSTARGKEIDTRADRRAQSHHIGADGAATGDGTPTALSQSRQLQEQPSESRTLGTGGSCSWPRQEVERLGREVAEAERVVKEETARNGKLEKKMADTMLRLLCLPNKN